MGASASGCPGAEGWHAAPPLLTDPSVNPTAHRPPPGPHLAGLGLEVVQRPELLRQQLLELQRGKVGRDVGASQGVRLMVGWVGTRC